MRAVKAALEKGEDAHAQLAHELLAALLHVADVEQWQRYNGRWARLSPLAGTTARREYMPDYMLFLAEIVERCR